MHFLSVPIISALVGVVAGSTDSTTFPIKRQSSCPSVWTDVAADLKASFVDSSGAATDTARAAIRVSFHDCFPGTCDGSIILAGECSDRGENSQMISVCTILGDMATEYNVSTADIIQLGTALGVAAALGPTIAFKVGRVDSSTADATGQMPGANDDADSVIAAFSAKGFTSTELVALVGAHSAAKTLAGVGLDSTVDDLDTTFYTETADGTAPASLNSDVYLSNSSTTSSSWSGFAASRSDWEAAFVPAMEKMGLLGNDESTLIDCSSVITDTFATTSTTTQAQNVGTSSDTNQTAAQVTSTSKGAGRGMDGSNAWMALFVCLFYTLL